MNPLDPDYDSVPRDTDASLQLSPEGASLAARTLHEIDVQLTDDSGVYGYKEESKRYGIAETIAALREISRIWHQRTGHRFGVGDISLQGGGNIEGHASHERGVDIDVRPLRNDWAETGVVHQSPAYSRELTQELIDLFYTNRSLGVKSVFFNDTATAGTSEWPNHDNHFHVRFHDPGVAAAPPLLQRGQGAVPAIYELQRCLNFWHTATGHPGLPLTIDGTFGQKTEQRVQEFQLDRSLTDDGVVGSDTWDALQHWRASAVIA